jgi:hypothetical protein
VILAFILGAELDTHPFRLTYTLPSGTPLFLANLLLNAAIGIMIAVLAAETVEQASRRRADRDIQRVERQSQEITAAAAYAVAKTVVGNIHSEDVWRELAASVFHTQLLRENYRQELSFERSRSHRNALNVSQILQYTIVNPSQVDAPFSPRFSFDNTSAVYPNKPEYQSPSLTGVRIGNHTFGAAEISALVDWQRSNASPSSLDMEPINLGDYTIPGEGRMDVRISYESVEPIDSHWVSRMFYPTKSVTLVVRNNVGPNFVVYLVSLFRESFAPAELLKPDGSHWERKYAGVILPSSGFELRWNDLKRR